MSAQKTANRWSILQVVNLGTFMLCLDVGIANVALPTMADQFGVALAQIQWVVTAYLLTMIALLPILGKLSDRFNRSRIYSYGFLVFTVGSFLISVSTSLTAILLSRCVQGLGAAMLLANSQAMVRQVFPDRERGKALGMNAVVISLGTLLGPAVGGILMEYGGWPMLFWMNVPFGLAALFLGLRWFPREQARSVQPIDWLGSLLLAAGTSAVLLALTGSGEEGFTTKVAIQLAIGFVLLAAMLAYERKIAYGILDRVLYRNRTILFGNLSAFLVNMAQMASLVPLLFHIQHGMGYSARELGLMLAVQPLLMGIGSPIAGWYRDKYGPLPPITAGALLCTLALLPIAFGAPLAWWSIALYLALFGLGLGGFHAANNVEIMTAAPEDKISLIGSLLGLIRNLGLVFGTGLAALLAGAAVTGGGTGQQAGALAGTLTADLDAAIPLIFLVCFALCMIVNGIGLYRARSSRVRAKTAGNSIPDETRGR